MNSLRCTLFGLALIPVLTSVTATAQTESQLDQRYTRLKAYSVRPNILLTVTVDRTGRVCEMVLEPRRYSEKSIVLQSNLSEQETIGVIEELVSESERGKRLVGIGGWMKSDLSGGFITTTYAYENITIQFHGTTRKQNLTSMVAVVTYQQRPCD